MRFLYRKYKENLIINRFVNLFSVDILVKGSSFILIPVYLKLLTQAEFGLYSYLTSIIAFFAQILNFGLFVSQSKIYQELEYEKRREFIFSLNILLLFLLCISLTIIYGLDIDIYLIGLLFKSPIDYKTYRLAMLLAIIASVYSFMMYNYFLTAEKIRIVQRYNVLRLVLLNSIVLCLLFYLKGNKISIRLWTTYTIEISLILSFAYQCIKEMTPVIDWKVMLRSVKIGFPIMISSICAVVLGFGDKFFLERKSGFLDLSVYYLAFSIASVIPLLFNTLQNIWLPLFLKEKELEKNLLLTKKMGLIILGLFMTLSVIMLVTIKIALTFNIIANNYNKVLYVLPVILLALSIENISHLLINYITYFEQTYIVPIISLVLGAISISLNILLIGKFGLYGAAYSSLCIGIISFSAYYIILQYNIRKFRIAQSS